MHSSTCLRFNKVLTGNRQREFRFGITCPMCSVEKIQRQYPFNKQRRRQQIRCAAGEAFKYNILVHTALSMHCCHAALHGLQTRQSGTVQNPTWS